MFWPLSFVTKAAIQKLKLLVKLQMKQWHLEAKKELVLRSMDRVVYLHVGLYTGGQSNMQRDDFICFVLNVLLKD